MRNSIVSAHSSSVARASKHSRPMGRAAQGPPDSQARDSLETRRSLARPTCGYCKCGGRAIKCRISVRECGRRRACRPQHIKATRKAAPQPRVSSPRSHESSPYRNRCGTGRCGYASELWVCQSKITGCSLVPEYRERRRGAHHFRKLWARSSGFPLQRSISTPHPIKMRFPVLTPPSSARFSLTRIGDLPGSSALLKKTARSR